MADVAQQHAQFLTTRWTTVAIATDPSSPETRAALEKLCQDYWPPLFAYALRQGHHCHAAQDLTQSFFARFIERGYLRAADRNRGRFRTFLLTCFQHFLIHEWEKTRAAKRGGQFTLLSWDEHRDALESRATSSTSFPAEEFYDREWALSIMQRALRSLRDEFIHNERPAHFEALAPFLHSEPSPGDYAAAATKLGLAPDAVKLAVHRLRRRYGRLVYEEVAETVASPTDIDGEIRYLIELIST